MNTLTIVEIIEKEKSPNVLIGNICMWGNISWGTSEINKLFNV